MEAPNYYIDGNVGGGWYCANCGAFVPINQSHQCPNISESIGNFSFQYHYPSDRDLLLKILEKLDEVLKSLAKK